MQTYKVFIIILFTMLAGPWVLAGIFAYIIWAATRAATLFGYGP
jgi:hypothetical protein